jgi:septal ring factor EnvC (AmiA/AmiB activator)
MAPLIGHSCDQLRTQIAGTKRLISHDEHQVTLRQSTLNRLKSQPDPDPKKIAIAQQDLDSASQKVDDDRQNLVDLQDEFDTICTGHHLEGI